ncbi:MAG: phosphotransferase [Bacteroidetes bacterium]|nr:phosphotransferase [Bacteroidota bacterium]
MTGSRKHAGSGGSAAGAEDLNTLRRIHADVFGVEPERVMRLKGDASDRMIYRLSAPAHSVIGIVGPNPAENRAFIGFARSFRAEGLPVPEIYATDDSERCYLEEDLGDVTLAIWQEQPQVRSNPPIGGEDREQKDPVIGMYTRVLETLLRFQVDAADALDYDLCYQTREFGHEAMEFDLCYFRQMYLERLVRIHWDREVFERGGSTLVQSLLAADRSYFLYRDFQSRNIMIRDGAPWFIDFQSGRRGALHYDIASLLYDSRGGLDDTDRMLLLEGYLDALETRVAIDRHAFLRFFDGFALLRLMQALGAFGNIGLNKGKPEYLDLIPSRLAALDALTARAEILDEIPEMRTLLLAVASDHPYHDPSH